MMTKNKFLAALDRGLRPLRREERRRLGEYYAEMIDDRAEEGGSEAEIISQLGAPEAVAAGILKSEPESSFQKRLSRGKIAWILALSPIWVSILAAAIAVCAAYASAILAFWASSVGGAALAVYFLFAGRTARALAYLGAALVLMGLGILAWRAAKAVIFLVRKSRRARIGGRK